MMNEIVDWLQQELERAEADYEMSADTEDAVYHAGESDAYRMVLEKLYNTAIGRLKDANLLANSND